MKQDHRLGTNSDEVNRLEKPRQNVTFAAVGNDSPERTLDSSKIYNSPERMRNGQRDTVGLKNEHVTIETEPSVTMNELSRQTLVQQQTFPTQTIPLVYNPLNTVSDSVYRSLQAEYDALRLQLQQIERSRELDRFEHEKLVQTLKHEHELQLMDCRRKAEKQGMIVTLRSSLLLSVSKKGDWKNCYWITILSAASISNFQQS